MTAALSKTRQAIAWMAEDHRRTAYQAAKHIGVSQSAISIALRRVPWVACPTCGHRMRDLSAKLNVPA